MVTTRSSSAQKKHTSIDSFVPQLSPTFSNSTHNSQTSQTSHDSIRTVNTPPHIHPSTKTILSHTQTSTKASPDSLSHTPTININPLLEAENMVLRHRPATNVPIGHHHPRQEDSLNDNDDDDNDDDYADVDVDFDNESSLEEETIPRISIRAVMARGNRNQYLASKHHDAPLVNIRVRPHCLTKESLGRSIVQAINATTGVCGMAHYPYPSLEGDSPLEGMFLEDDGLFVPLEDILHSPREYHEAIFALSPPVSIRPSSSPHPLETQEENNNDDDEPSTKRSMGVSLFAIVAITTFLLNKRSQISFCGECLWDSFGSLFKLFLLAPFAVDQIFVHWPLEQLYRYGPSFLGWEGARLSTICARITYYGDEPFWQNNMEECERTYAKKVAASMFIRKPFVYFVLVYSGVKALKLLLSFRTPPKNDPDMEETFKAIHSIVRQLKKAAGKP